VGAVISARARLSVITLLIDGSRIVSSSSVCSAGGGAGGRGGDGAVPGGDGANGGERDVVAR
ncbi:MAG: hypothetical protein QME96_16580, partial [Myxococcota bacterium]|nr:hypothetical protein [Myxococcota bacterium]